MHHILLALVIFAMLCAVVAFHAASSCVGGKTGGICKAVHAIL